MDRFLLKGYIASMAEKDAAKDFKEDPFFKKLLEDAKAEQWRYSPEPVFFKPGKGQLKSIGVEEIAKVKAQAKRNERE